MWLLVRGRHGRCEGLTFHLAKALVVAEKECLVLYDGTADAGAKLVLAQLSFWPVRSRSLDPGVGIEDIVAEELECRSVKIVRSRFRNEIYHAAHRAPNLGRVKTGQHLDFLNCID